jgi:hypothetical protein
MPRRVASLRERVRAALLRLDGVEESPSGFADVRGFWVNGKEIAHFEGGVVDLRLSRAVIREHRARLKADPRVTLRRSGADWLEVALARPADVAFVAELGELAAAAHRAPAGAVPRRPPERAELERRRRFH